MRIGIDAYPIARKIKAGIGYYTHYILKNILEVDNKNEYFLYNNLGKGTELSSANLHIPYISSRSFINKFSTSWMLFNAKRQLIRDRIDIFWSTQGIIAPAISGCAKTVITIHDLTFYLYPNTMAMDNYFVNKFLFAKSIINAHKIITVSESTANDLRNIFKKSDIHNKISVVHNGVDSRFRPMDKAASGKQASCSLGVSDKFILFVGTLEPRKNIPALLHAFKILKTKYNIPHQLILVGAKGWRTTGIYSIYQQLSFSESEVKFLGYVEEEDLFCLYCAAEVLVMPSLYEGFGIPPLEAMACGTPVVASAIPIFKETLGSAALLVEPSNYHDIAEGIYKIINNAELKNNLTRQGFERVKLFSWRKSAQEIIKIFNNLIP